MILKSLQIFQSPVLGHIDRLFLSALVFLFLTACQKDNNRAQPPDAYWQVDSPGNQGLQTDSVEKIIQVARDLPNFYALIVIRNNRLIVEEYFNGQGPNDLQHLRSITKNFTSALTDIAIQKGIIDSLDERLLQDFPDALSENKINMTIRHLLNMSSGLEWDEDAEVVPLIEHEISNPVTTILSRSLLHEPGTVFNYNSVSPHIVSTIISTRSGISFEQFAEDYLFEPLGMLDYAWTRDPTGKVWGGFGLQITPRDLAKFGQLYLQQGQWDGNPLITMDWIKLSQTTQIETASGNAGYSLQWYISKSFSSPLFFGNGYGGQGLMILPEEKMIVVGMHHYLVTQEQNSQQWGNFINRVFIPLFNALID